MKRRAFLAGVSALVLVRPAPRKVRFYRYNPNGPNYPCFAGGIVDSVDTPTRVRSITFRFCEPVSHGGGSIEFFKQRREARLSKEQTS